MDIRDVSRKKYIQKKKKVNAIIHQIMKFCLKLI